MNSNSTSLSPERLQLRKLKETNLRLEAHKTRLLTEFDKSQVRCLRFANILGYRNALEAEIELQHPSSIKTDLTLRACLKKIQQLEDELDTRPVVEEVRQMTEKLSSKDCQIALLKQQ